MACQRSRPISSWAVLMRSIHDCVGAIGACSGSCCSRNSIERGAGKPEASLGRTLAMSAMSFFAVSASVKNGVLISTALSMRCGQRDPSAIDTAEPTASPSAVARSIPSASMVSITARA